MWISVVWLLVSLLAPQLCAGAAVKDVYDNKGPELFVSIYIIYISTKVVYSSFVCAIHDHNSCVRMFISLGNTPFFLQDPFDEM